MDNSAYQSTLFSTCDPEEITRLSKIVFVEGHLDKIDDLIVAILPLANIVYYKYIRYLDDREYAKEDLISDAILRLYQDMTLRWDKYIHIESHYEYYSTILRNGMVGLVHGYHSFYSIDDVDLEAVNPEEEMISAYDAIELNIMKEAVRKNILDTATHILECRTVNTKLLVSILQCMYVTKSGLDSLKDRVRVLGISNNLFNFYCEHVRYAYKLAYNYHYAQIGGKQKMMDRISGTLDRFEDITYKMLSANYYDSIIPEIYAEFGADIAKKFVKTFSGRTVQVPEYRDFCDDLLGGAVLSLSEGDKSNLYRIAEEYNIPYRSLARIYNKASKYDL